VRVASVGGKQQFRLTVRWPDEFEFHLGSFANLMPTTIAYSSKSEEAEKLRLISHADTPGTEGTVDGEMRMPRDRLCRCGRMDMTR